MSGIFPGWKVVAGAGVGLAFCSSVFIGSTFSLLAAAIGAQYGWTPAQLALGASIVLFMQIFTYPAAGMLADRIGSRRAAMFAITMFAAGLVALSQIGKPVWHVLGNPLHQYYASFLLIGLFSAGTNAVSYTRALTLWFDQRRGIAIGAAAAFQAIGATVMPIAFQRIISVSDWQTALLLLAGGLMLVCLPAVAIYVKDSPADLGLNADGADVPDAGTAGHEALPRRSLASLLTDPLFRQLALAFSVMGFAAYALTTNAVMILTSAAGLSLPQVATIQAISGASILLGRIGFGLLLDRFNGALVATFAVLLGGSVFVSYGLGGSFSAIVATAVVAGVSIGGESDLMPYLAGRYFGRDAVSSVFGWFLSAFVIGAALGPVVFAQAASALGSPVPVLFVIAALHIVPASVFIMQYRRG
jgi:MFS family permease